MNTAAAAHTVAGNVILYIVAPVTVIVLATLIIALPRMYRALILLTDAVRRVLAVVEPDEGPSLATSMALMKQRLDRLDEKKG